MSRFDEMNHYDALEIPPDATREEIERAYRVACATYADDSMALYSLFEAGDGHDGGEVGAIRDRIQRAYRVLSDPVTRRAYDAEQAGEETPEGDSAADPDSAADSALLPDPPALRSIARAEGFESLAEAEPDDGTDGPGLRRARLRRGVEMDQIAAETKINPTYLRFIEEENFDELPAPVYVRGFVTAYARCLGMDSARVVEGYMGRLAAHEQAVRSGRRARR